VGFDLPFAPTELENFILRIGHARRGNWRGGRGSDSDEMAAAKEFGARLFGAVFQGDVYACLRASLSEARAKKQGVRVLLRLSPELANLPWEYLYNPAWNQFFSLSVDTPLVRYLELTPQVAPLEVSLPLRLLAVISSPTDYDALDVEREWRDLQNALQPLVARGLMQIERLESASLLALQRQLRRTEYHVFHFIGHGSFDEHYQDGILIFSDEHGRGRPLSGQDLGILLRNHNSLRLALLNTCEGARTGKDDPFAGVAHSLVQMGLPAVIAMQFEISDASAILFAQEFYAALADGYGVDAALTDARTAIFASGGSVEWGTPVLFSRTLDGRIFDLTPAPTLPASPVTQPPDAKLSPLPKHSTVTFVPEIARLYEDGLSAVCLEDWAKARDSFEAVLQIRRDYRDAAERLAQAQQQLDWAQRYQQAQALLERSDGAGALILLEKLAGEAPGYHDVADLLQQTRQQIHLQSLYADALRQSQAGEWQAVINSFAQIAKLQADYPDPSNLLSIARNRLATQEREEKLAGLYSDALQAMDNQRWSEAQRLLGQIQKTQPGYREVPRLLEKARAEMDRQRSGQGGGRLWAWLALLRRGAAFSVLVVIEICGIIFILSKMSGMLPIVTPPSETPVLTLLPIPSATIGIVTDVPSSQTPTLPLSPTPSATFTLWPSATFTITPMLTQTRTPIPPLMGMVRSDAWLYTSPDGAVGVAMVKSGNLVTIERYCEVRPYATERLNATETPGEYWLYVNWLKDENSQSFWGWIRTNYENQIIVAVYGFDKPWLIHTDKIHLINCP
jgi:outer membrane protein assembly factor BamD (BamD/ComL family)